MASLIEKKQSIKRLEDKQHTQHKLDLKIKGKEL